VEEPRRHAAPVRRPLPPAVRWVVLAAGGAAFAGVSELVPGLLPFVAVALWAVAALTVPCPRHLAVDGVALGLVVGLVVAVRHAPVPFALTTVLVLVGALTMGQALHRDRSGLVRQIGRTEQADAVLVDLRDRARSHARVPELPPGWHIESDLRPAGGDSFGGDFLVAAHRERDRLDLVLVDVAGNGGGAGSRALLFTGAFAALLESVPREDFLPAANRYVLRHGGEDGLATAVHASVDLTAGTYSVASAGHPPAAHFHAGSGRWDLLEGDGGPLLGVLPDAGYGQCRGTLAPGDALLLYTDGMVENRRLDVVRGIDRLIGVADPVLARGQSGGAALIAAGARGVDDGGGDDRAVVVIRRWALTPGVRS
jgi:hypothetical protein